MTHPFAKHREHMVQKDRVSSLHGYATGGAVAEFDAPKKATGGAVVKKAAPKQRMAGGAVKARLDRRARGGKTKHREEGGEATSPERAAHNRGVASKMIKGALDKGYTGGLAGLGLSGLNPAAGAAGMAAGAAYGAGKAYSDSSGIKMHNKDMDGQKKGGRVKRAMGGRTKHKGKTIVNVNVGHGQPNAVPVPVPAGGPPGAPPMMPPRPAMAPPMAGPPGMPPGGMPPGMPPGAPMMHKDGGRVQRAKGGKVKRRADGGYSDDESPMTAQEHLQQMNRAGKTGFSDWPERTRLLGRSLKDVHSGTVRTSIRQPGELAPHEMILGPDQKKQGGAIKRARGGSVKDGPTWKEGLKNGTQVSNTPGNSALKDVGRSKAITFNKGGKVPQLPAGTGEAPISARKAYAQGGKAMAPGFDIKAVRGARGLDRLGVTMTEGGGPKLPGGAAGGEARLAKIRMYGGK